MSHRRVLVTRRVPPPAVELLRSARCDVDYLDQLEPPAREVVLRHIAGAAGAILMLTDRVDDQLLDAAGPGLRVLANFGVGTDNIDAAACKKRGVRACNTPDVLTDATADLTWALILAAARHVVQGHQLVQAGGWTGWTPTQFLGLQVTGATLGIVGAGRIGTAVGLRAIGFRMPVLYTDRQPSPELEQRVDARRVELEQLLQASDVVTLHCPLTPETRHLLSAERLKLMKRTAILINAARGPVVDEAALVQLLGDGRIAAAGLDVYEREPQLAEGLARLPNVVLLPHLGSATSATRQKMSQLCAENVIAVLDGREPKTPVV